MPTTWSKDAEEAWAAMPPATQQLVAQREAQREAAVAAKFEEASSVRKAAEASRAAAEALRAEHAEALRQIMQLLEPRRPDMALLDDQSEHYDPARYFRETAQFEESRDYLAQLQQQRQALVAQQEKAEADALAALWQDGRARLREAIPDLFDPAKARELGAALESYALSKGVPAEDFAVITPAQAEILWEAMQYRRARDAAAQIKAQPRPATPGIRPGVRAAIVNPASKALADAQNAFDQGPTLESAARLLSARRGT
jgi:hypothetical protein